MRIAAILIGLVGFAALAAGCSSCPSDCYSNCDVSWDFYEPCNLIEGRAERCCAENPCGINECDTGVIMVVNDCVPISGGPSEAVVLEEEIIEEEVMEEPVVDDK